MHTVLLTKKRKKIKPDELFFTLLLCAEMGHFGNSLLELICFILMLLQISRSVLSRKNVRISVAFNRKYFRYVVLFSSFSLLSVIWAINFSAYADAAPSIIKCLFVVYYILYYGKDKEKSFRFIVCFIVATCYMGLRIILYTPFAGGFRYGLADRVTRIATGMGFNPVANLSMWSLIIALFFLWNTKNRIWALPIVIDIVIIFVTGSRKSMLIPLLWIAMYYAILLVITRRAKILYRICIGIALGIVVIYILLRVSNELNERMISLMLGLFTGETSDGSYNVRQFLIEKAVSIFKKNPVIGIGLNNYSVFGYQQYNQYTDITGRYAHNNYWELLASLGIIGTVLYYLRYLLCIKQIYTLRKKMSKENFSLALSIVISVFIVEYGVVSYNLVPFQSVFVLVVAYCLYQQNFKDKPVKPI